MFQEKQFRFLNVFWKLYCTICCSEYTAKWISNLNPLNKLKIYILPDLSDIE